MKNTRVHILIVTLLTFIAGTSHYGCKDRELRTDYIDQTLKEYCLYQEGSYWIYQNSTGDIDSLYLYQREDHIVEDDDRNYESIDLRYNSSYYPSDFFGMASSPFVGGGGHLSEYWNSAYLTPMGGFFIFSQAIDTPGLETEVLAGTEEKYTAYYEITLIGDSTYKNVRQYDFNMGNLLSRRTIYWAKGIGRVKYIDGDSTVWNLIKYNVTQ
jgi:hypothetical protein